MKITNTTSRPLFLPLTQSVIEPGASCEIPDSEATSFENHPFFSVAQPPQSPAPQPAAANVAPTVVEDTAISETGE